MKAYYCWWCMCYYILIKLLHIIMVLHTSFVMKLYDEDAAKNSLFPSHSQALRMGTMRDIIGPFMEAIKGGTSVVISLHQMGCATLLWCLLSRC